MQVFVILALYLLIKDNIQKHFDILFLYISIESSNYYLI